MSRTRPLEEIVDVIRDDQGIKSPGESNESKAACETHYFACRIRKCRHDINDILVVLGIGAARFESLYCRLANIAVS